jgi:hypothetical protein
VAINASDAPQDLALGAETAAGWTWRTAYASDRAAGGGPLDVLPARAARVLVGERQPRVP